MARRQLYQFECKQGPEDSVLKGVQFEEFILHSILNTAIWGSSDRFFHYQKYQLKIQTLVALNLNLVLL